MIRLVSKATLLSALGVLAASYVMAGVPNATQSTVGTKILITGYNGSTTDPGGGFAAKTITVRDAANNPVGNSVVILNFNGCAPPPGAGPANGVKLSASQVGAGMTLNAGARSVSGTTNSVTGAVTFRVCGASNNSVNNASEPVNCVAVTADGVPLGSLSVATYDHNGDGDINGSDSALFAADRFGIYRNRSDYNLNNLMDGSDSSAFTAARFGSFGGHPGGGAQQGQIGPFVP